MDVVAKFWFIWLIAAIVCYVGSIWNHIGTIKDVMGDKDKNPLDSFKYTVILGLSGTGFFIVLLISVVLNIIILVIPRT